MNNRIIGIDVIKGISIFLVVFYHTVTSNYIHPEFFFAYLGAFLLNAFFFAAGWVFAYSENDNYSLSIRKKIIVLGVPYVVLSLMAIIYQFIVGTVLGNNFISDTYFGKELLLRNLYCAVSLTGIGTLWFLPVILIANIVIILLVGKIQDNKKRMLVIGAVCLFLYLFYVLFFDRINIQITGTVSKIISEEIRFINRIIIGCVYILLGYLMNKLLSKWNKENLVNIFIGIMCLIVGAILYHFDIEFYKMFYTLSECLIVIFICNYKWVGVLAEPIRFLGENSLYIMVIHYIFVQPIIMKVVWTSYYLMDSSILEKRIILFIIEWLVTLLIIVLGKKNDEFLFLFGKGKQFKRMMKKMLRRMRCYE